MNPRRKLYHWLIGFAFGVFDVADQVLGKQPWEHDLANRVGLDSDPTEPECDWTTRPEPPDEARDDVHIHCWLRAQQADSAWIPAADVKQWMFDAWPVWQWKRWPSSGPESLSGYVGAWVVGQQRQGCGTMHLGIHTLRCADFQGTWRPLILPGMDLSKRDGIILCESCSSPPKELFDRVSSWQCLGTQHRYPWRPTGWPELDEKQPHTEPELCNGEQVQELQRQLEVERGRVEGQGIGMMVAAETLRALVPDAGQDMHVKNLADLVTKQVQALTAELDAALNEVAQTAITSRARAKLLQDELSSLARRTTPQGTDEYKRLMGVIRRETP